MRVDVMNQEEMGAEELQRLQRVIGEKMERIRNVLNEQDRALVEELVARRGLTTDPIYPRYDRKLSYYQEFWKVYVLNEIMISKIKDYATGNQILQREVALLDSAEKEWTHIWTQRTKKKVRRTSDQIEKAFRCPFEKCLKVYGSDVSLNLHMKLKHNSGTKTERESLAKDICLAEEKGLTIPSELNFPPGYLEAFRQTFWKDHS